MNELQYIENWQKSCVRQNDFYETHAQKRTYFYSIDLQGRLFLEETSPKNIATSLKSDKFLDFFFSNLRRNDTPLFADRSAIYYPYFSPCGPEKNYIRPADVAVVFHDLKQSSGGSGLELVFGGTLLQSFSPKRLAMSLETGRLYHELYSSDAPSSDASAATPDPSAIVPSSFSSSSSHSSSKRAVPRLQRLPLSICEYGLIKSSIGVTLSPNILLETEEGEGEGEMVPYFVEDGEKQRIKILPERCESRDWGLPPL